MSDTKDAALARVPSISERSPLAEGFTINIMDARERGTPIEDPSKPWHLRVWAQGQAIESSFHDKPSSASMRLGAIVMDGTVGARARDIAKGLFSDLMRGGRGKSDA